MDLLISVRARTVLALTSNVNLSWSAVPFYSMTTSSSPPPARKRSSLLRRPLVRTMLGMVQ